MIKRADFCLIPMTFTYFLPPPMHSPQLQAATWRMQRLGYWTNRKGMQNANLVQLKKTYCFSRWICPTFFFRDWRCEQFFTTPKLTNGWHLTKWLTKVTPILKISGFLCHFFVEKRVMESCQWINGDRFGCWTVFFLLWVVFGSNLHELSWILLILESVWLWSKFELSLPYV